MRSLVWMPLGVLLAAAVALLILRQAGGNPHTREVLTAAGIALIACELAVLPLLIARRAGHIAMAQAALAGTVLHMFFMLATGAAAYWMKLAGDQKYFLFLLLGFYWISLIFIVTAMIQAVRHASAAPSPMAKTA